MDDLRLTAATVAASISTDAESPSSICPASDPVSANAVEAASAKTAACTKSKAPSQCSDTDWQRRRGLVECNRFMLENQLSCDVTFLVGTTDDTREEIPAHKYMLLARSPVFHAMFCGKLASNTTSPIRVVDVEPDAFRLLLRYMYCDETDLSADLVLPTLYASKKYLLPALTEHCIDYLESSLLPDNVCLIYEQSILYDETSLVEKCVAFIESKTEDVLHAATFPDTSLQTLIRILKLECLTIKELDLFQGCLRWATAECRRQDLELSPLNKRTVLGEALYCLHFPAMSLKDFSNVVARTGVLTAEEKCSIFEYLTSDESDPSTADLKFPFSHRERPRPSVLTRFTLYGKSNVYSGDCSMMKLQCDKALLIKGLGINGSISYDPLAEVQVTIKQDRTFLCNKSMTVVDDMSGDIISVMLPEKILLKPNIWYTVIVTFNFYGDYDQGSCRRGKGGKKAVACDGINFEFDRADSAGFIPQLFFSRV